MRDTRPERSNIVFARGQRVAREQILLRGQDSHSTATYGRSTFVNLLTKRMKTERKKKEKKAIFPRHFLLQLNSRWVSIFVISVSDVELLDWYWIFATGSSLKGPFEAETM
jgi:hypothetical protein